MTSVFTGFETNEITFIRSPEVTSGKVVMIMEDSTVYTPSEGEAFCGVCSAVKGDYATVVLHGCATVSFYGMAPQIGYNKLATDSEGGVKIDNTNGKEYLVVSVDTSTMTIELLV